MGAPRAVASISRDPGAGVRGHVSAVKLTDSTSAIADLGKQHQITEGYPPQIFKASLSHIDLTVVAENESETKAKSDIRLVASPRSGIKTPRDLPGLGEIARGRQVRLRHACCRDESTPERVDAVVTSIESGGYRGWRCVHIARNQDR